MKGYRLGLPIDRRDKLFMRDNSQEVTMGRGMFLGLIKLRSRQ
jgi:hypothetical protein